MKRLLDANFLALLLVATAAVLWSGLNLPPPLWILKYGLHPGCRPTGKTVKVEGVEFEMIGPGICRIGSDYLPVTRRPPRPRRPQRRLRFLGGS